METVVHCVRIEVEALGLITFIGFRILKDYLTGLGRVEE